MKRSRSDEFNEKTKLQASIRWLLTKAYGTRIPAAFKQIFVTSQSGTYSIHPELVTALTNGHIYCLACSNLFPDTSKQWDDFPAVFSHLAERGFPVVDVHGAFIRVDSLQRAVSFYPEVHLYLVDTMMTARVADLVSIEAVLKSIRSFSTTFLHAGTTALQARTCEEALHLWLRCACRTALKMASCGQGVKDKSGSGEAVQDLPSNLSDQQADHYTRQLAFATRLALLANFYAPDLMPFRNLHLGLHLTRNANQYNARRFLDFVEANLAKSPVVHFCAEDLVRCARPPTAGPLRINFNVLLAELYNQFEGAAGSSQFQPSCKVYYTYPVPRPSQPAEKLPEVDFSKSRAMDTTTAGGGGGLRSFRLDDAEPGDDLYRDSERRPSSAASNDNYPSPRPSVSSPVPTPRRRGPHDRSMSLTSASMPASPSHSRRRASASSSSSSATAGHNALEALFSPPATPRRLHSGRHSADAPARHGTFTKNSLEVMRWPENGDVESSGGGISSGTFRLHRNGRRSPIRSVFPNTPTADPPMPEEEEEAYLTPTEEEPEPHTTFARVSEKRRDKTSSRQRSSSTTSLPPVASVSLTTRYHLRRSRQQQHARKKEAEEEDLRTTWAKLQRTPSVDSSPQPRRKSEEAAVPTAEVQAALNRRKQTIERGKRQAVEEAERALRQRSHAAFTAKVLQAPRSKTPDPSADLQQQHQRLKARVEKHLASSVEEKPASPRSVKAAMSMEELPTSGRRRGEDDGLEDRVKALQAEVESLKEQYASDQVLPRPLSPAPSVQSSPAWTSHMSDLDRLRVEVPPSSSEYAVSLERLNTSLSDLQSEILRLSLQQERINKTLSSPHHPLVGNPLSKAMTSSGGSISGSSQSGRATWSQRTPVTEILPATSTTAGFPPEPLVSMPPIASPVTTAAPRAAPAFMAPAIAPMPYFVYGASPPFPSPQWAGGQWAVSVDPNTGLMTPQATSPGQGLNPIVDSPPGKPFSPELVPQQEEDEEEEQEEEEEDEEEEEEKEDPEEEEAPAPVVIPPRRPPGLFFVDIGDEDTPCREEVERTEAEGAAATESVRLDGGLAGTSFVLDSNLEEVDELGKRRERLLAASARRRMQQQASKGQSKDSEAARRRAAERVREAKKQEDKIRRETIYQAYLERKSGGADLEDGSASVYAPASSSRTASPRKPRGPKAGGGRGRSANRDSPKPNRAVSEERLNDSRLTYQHRSQSSTTVSSSNGGSEPNSPALKLFVQPRVKSNRSVIINALTHCCLAGTVNQSMLELVLSELQVVEGSHFMILFRDSGCQYRSLYIFNTSTEECQRMTGVGPKKIRHSMVQCFYKYNCGAKKFMEITSTNHLSPVVDAFTVFNKFWKKCPTCGGGVKNANRSSSTTPTPVGKRA